MTTNNDQSARAGDGNPPPGLSLDDLRRLWAAATPLRMPELPPHELGAREVAFARSIEAARPTQAEGGSDSAPPTVWQVAAGFFGRWESIPVGLRDDAIPLYARPASAPSVPAGMVLVPLEPTQQMCQEGQWKAQEWPRFPLRIAPIWKAMLAAAPTADTGWRGLTQEERAAFVNEICEYGTGFVAPLFSLAESLENVLKVRNSAAAPAAASAWQPIKTAPKDGSLFLCWVYAVNYGETDEGQQYQVDVSQADFCQWQAFEEAPDGGWFEPCCGHIADGQDITHWMPLPAAPGFQAPVSPQP